MKVLIALVVLVVALASAGTMAPPSKLAADPTKPVWPPNFSASVLTHGSHGPSSFFRWFYSQTLNKDRFDTMREWNSEFYFEKKIFDHSTQTEFTVYEQIDEVTCFQNAINRTIPHPDFASFTYVGESVIDYATAYHWFYVDKARNLTFQYFDAQATREPVRIDIYDSVKNFSETWMFFEFDESAQDANLFILSAAVAAVCNKV